MRGLLRHILAAFVLAACLCSCGREGKVIPRNKFASIYAEMFLADAWLSTASPDDRLRSDTTAFYEPIFEKYGYTIEDYWASVSYYLQDPDRFSRILHRSRLQLESQIKALQAEMEAESVVNTDDTAIDDEGQAEKPKKRERLPRRERKVSEELQVTEED